LIASTHLLAGAVTGVVVAGQTKGKRPFVLSVCALICGIFFAHFFLDMISHAEYYMDKTKIRFIFILSFEIFVSLTAILISSFDLISERKYFIGIIAAVFGSALPDLSNVLYRVFGLNWWWLEKWMEFNSFFHVESNGITVSIATQVWIASHSFLFLSLFNLRYRKKILRRVDSNRESPTK